MTRIRVSDHAMVRYFERVHGFDVESLRNQIAQRVKPAAKLAAALGNSGSVQIDGLSYTFVCNSDGSVVVTTIRPPQDHPFTRPVQAYRKHRERD